MEIEVLIISIALILLFVYLVIEAIMTFRKRPTISPIPIILLLIGILFAILVHYRGKELIASDWAQILLMIGLVAVTAVYAWSTQRQAKANEKMAEEMRQQRITASRPLLVQKAIYEKDIWDSSTSDYFVHFEAYNKGNGPAIEVEISLLDSEKNQIDSHRNSFFGVGEPPIIFRPESLVTMQENSTYYIVCEYQSIVSSIPQKKWYQTWLPFKTSKSSKKDKIYVVSGELEFCEVSEKDRIDAFSSRSKPK